ncbi:uncharacterized protein LOC117129858 [Brassica rapa]|uniref:uncharacterized protein LOC117129858 n=1 Tax=Brassica campestris TaxID=3711 RepID=UPI00142D4931|nr:uncharacterized protein LOC117129858 [Brassica rapa]
MKEREARAHVSDGAGPSNRGAEGEGREGDGKALVTYSATPNIRGNDQDFIRRSEMDALIKMLKENGNIHGYSFGASMIARTINTTPYVTDIARMNSIKSSDNARAEYTFDRNARMYHELKAFRSPLNLCHTASNITKPLIVDSGASHHMISDTNLIKDIEPTNGHVMIANGDKIPIRGIGNLKLFDKNSRDFYMPDFTSNLLSVKKCTTDLNCNVIFSPNDVKFQDIESSQMIGKGITKGELYLLEELEPVSNHKCSFTSASSLNKNALWHARLGHPHGRALNLMLPGGYKCYDPDARRVLVSREVKFVETKGYYEEKKWEDLKDLSQAPSNKATILRVLLEKLGIGEQEQNQEDSGHHNQEDGAQSSRDEQGQSTGSDESVAQSTGSDESVAQSTGSEESGAQSSEGVQQEAQEEEQAQEAMGSEEDDETFMRRNKMLQEAITKQVMDAMVKLLEEKYDQRPIDGQGQASGQRRE